MEFKLIITQIHDIYTQSFQVEENIMEIGSHGLKNGFEVKGFKEKVVKDTMKVTISRGELNSRGDEIM